MCKTLSSFEQLGSFLREMPKVETSLFEVLSDNKSSEVAKKKAAEEKKTHIVTDFEDARDYLAETFGVSRSKLKTKEDILSIAKENGVELEGLE